MTSIGVVLGISLAVLVVHNLGVERLSAALYVPACLATTGALLALAGAAGIGGDEIGVSAAGLGVGSVAGVAVAVVVVSGGLLPVTRPLFADRRMAGVGPLGTAYRALVRVPMGTVVLEEVAFRGVLLVLLDRLVPTGWAVAGSSLLFGVWHVVPMVATLRTNGLAVRPRSLGAAVVATGIVATGIAGAGFCWLRLSTGGLVAPMIVHASVSATATVVAAVALRQAGRSGAGSGAGGPIDRQFPWEPVGRSH